MKPFKLYAKELLGVGRSTIYKNDSVEVIAKDRRNKNTWLKQRLNPYGYMIGF